MANWNELAAELKARGSAHDIMRREYLAKLHDVTQRNVIAYYSGWLQKGALTRHGLDFSLNDSDKTGFMTTIYELDRSKGLDLILHTPGGSTSALESLVHYLRQMFGTNMRAIIPQLALSAGTMIALACKEIIMGKHSSLGPIDPQIGGLPAHAILEEFEQAKKDAQLHQHLAIFWQAIVGKYSPALVGECKKAIKWSDTMTREWLTSGMFGELDPKDADKKASEVLIGLGSHTNTLSHDRHYSFDKAKEIGVNVKRLEDDKDLQEAVLNVHHMFILSLTDTGAYKIIENHNGIAFIQQVQQVVAVQ